MKDEYYQMVNIELVLPEVFTPGRMNRIFKESGATLHYDVYSFERKEKGPDWQSDSYIHIHLFLNEKEVDAQESANRVILSYPLATISSEYISFFQEKVTALGSVFGAKAHMKSELISAPDLILYCENCVTDLMENFGEEPGSKTLAILIESNYG